MVSLSEALNYAALSAAPEADAVRQQFLAFIEELVSGAEADPGYSGLLGLIARAEIGGRKLTHEEAVSLATTLVVAGHETTVNGIASLLWLVATHPEVRTRLLGDRSLIAQTVEEALRVESPVRMMGRTATRSLELEGVAVTPGDKVGIFFVAANLDAREFDNPGVFDIDRDARAHLAFGHGIHRCLGEHLARLELCIALERVLDRIPDCEIDGEVTVGTSFPMNRGLLALPVRFEPRAKGRLEERRMTPPPEELSAVDSCVHCRTVTWAGNPACGCIFGQLAVDEDAVDALLLPVAGTSLLHAMHQRRLAYASLKPLSSRLSQ